MQYLLLSLFALCLLTACEKPEEAPPPPRPALVMTVGATAVETDLTLVGEVRPRYESAQGFRVPGKIIERLVDMGAHVSKNQVLARLDAVDNQLNANAAAAEVQSQQANYELAVAEVARQRQLFDKKFISAAALDIKEAELKTASARLAKAKAQAHVSGNQTQYSELKADREGVVTYIQAEPGQVVASGDPIVRIADTEHVDVRVAVPESRLAEVKPQAKVNLNLWADRQKKYNGVVREIAPLADSATRTFMVRITVQDANADINLGMTVGVQFQYFKAENDSDLLIPSTALTATAGKTQVWVIDADNRAHPREVEAGDFREDGVLIRHGLHVGETIVIAGVHTLNTDQLVRPVKEGKP